jgi:hypothetical protein
MLICKNKHYLWMGSDFPFQSFLANPGTRGPSQHRPRHFQSTSHSRRHNLLHTTCTVERSSLNKRKWLSLRYKSLRNETGYFTIQEIISLWISCIYMAHFRATKEIGLWEMTGRFRDGDNAYRTFSDFRKRYLANQGHKIHVLTTAVLASLVF